MICLNYFLHFERLFRKERKNDVKFERIISGFNLPHEHLYSSPEPFQGFCLLLRTTPSIVVGEQEVL